jgi:hypothetical protein
MMAMGTNPKAIAKKVHTNAARDWPLRLPTSGFVEYKVHCNDGRSLTSDDVHWFWLTAIYDVIVDDPNYFAVQAVGKVHNLAWPE